MDAEKSSTLLGVRIMLRGQLKIYSGEHLTIITHSKNTFLMSLNEITLHIMDWHKDLYVYKARNGFSKRLHDDGLHLCFVHGFKKLTCIKNMAVLTQCHPLSLSWYNIDCWASKYYSIAQEWSVFFRLLSEVPICLIFVIRLKCDELADLALWWRLELGYVVYHASVQKHEIPQH